MHKIIGNMYLQSSSLNYIQQSWMSWQISLNVQPISPVIWLWIAWSMVWMYARRLLHITCCEASVQWCIALWLNSLVHYIIIWSKLLNKIHNRQFVISLMYLARSNWHAITTSCIVWSLFYSQSVHCSSQLSIMFSLSLHYHHWSRYMQSQWANIQVCHISWISWYTWDLWLTKTW